MKMFVTASGIRSRMSLLMGWSSAGDELRLRTKPTATVRRAGALRVPSKAISPSWPVPYRLKVRDRSVVSLARSYTPARVLLTESLRWRSEFDELAVKKGIVLEGVLLTSSPSLRLFSLNWGLWSSSAASILNGCSFKCFEERERAQEIGEGRCRNGYARRVDERPQERPGKDDDLHERGEKVRLLYDFDS